MDFGAAFVAGAEASELVQPGDGAFHDPSQTPQGRIVIGAAAWQERLCGSMIVHNASPNSGLATPCLPTRSTHRKVHAIPLESLNRECSAERVQIRLCQSISSMEWTASIEMLTLPSSHELKWI